MRRRLVIALVLLLGLVPAAASASKDPVDDATPLATRAMLADGLLRIGTPEATGGHRAPAALAPARVRRIAAGVARRPDATVTARLAHRTVVRVLGLNAERTGLARLTAGGVPLARPPGLATEVLVRELGLRPNRPSAEDGLERTGREPLSAEDLDAMIRAALVVDSWDLERLTRYRDVALPPMGPRARTVVEAALRQVGQPYVWGGDAPTRRSRWGPQAHGGFDCSGLVWWAFKGDRRSAALGLGEAIEGRTADAMAWEAPGRRIPVDAAVGGDLVFFGPHGTRTARGAISHVGIALGGGWIVHSAGSRNGPSISHLDDYWPSGAAFARRMRLD